MITQFLAALVFCTPFFVNLPSLTADSQSLHQIQALEKAIDALKEAESRPFAIVDLGISSREQQCIDSLQVNSFSDCNFYGNLESLQTEIPAFLRSIGNSNEQDLKEVTAIIKRVITQVIQATHKETAWVAIRATTPSTIFDIPRWHYDGYFFPPFSGFSYKFAIVLKGKPTLFLPLPNHMREVFHQYEDDRLALHKLFDKSLVITASQGQGAFFVVGDKHRAAIHSEPKLDEPRLFISVLPGSFTDIEALKQSWQQ